MRAALLSPLWRSLFGGALLMAALTGCVQVPEQPPEQQPPPQSPPQPQQQAPQPQQPHLPGHLVNRPPLLPLGLPDRVLYVSALDDKVDISAPHKMTPEDLARAQAGQFPPGVTFEMLARGIGAWTPATLNWPVAQNFLLRTAPDARVEFGDGAITVRMGGAVELKVGDLLSNKGNGILVSSNKGSVSVRVRRLQRNEHVKISTPTLTLLISEPGEYRLDADPGAGTIQVIVHSGAVKVMSAGAKSNDSMPIASGQQVTFSPGATTGVLNVVGNSPAPKRDAFDQWGAERDGLLGKISALAKYVSPDIPGIQALDGHGQWAHDPTYGFVWYPKVADRGGWMPYTTGNWVWIEPWGWTWVDAAPWGFAPYHYGRWALIGQRWAWVPGPQTQLPVYAPALVGFGGGGRNSGRVPGQDWFPLAPGEYWQPDAVGNSNPPDATAPGSDAGAPVSGAGAPGYDAGGSVLDSGDDGYAPSIDDGPSRSGRARSPRQPQRAGSASQQRPSGLSSQQRPSSSSPQQRPGGSPSPQHSGGSSLEQRPDGSPPPQHSGGFSPPPQRSGGASPSSPPPARPSSPPPAPPHSAPPPPPLPSAPSHFSPPPPPLPPPPPPQQHSDSSSKSDDKKK
jgi:hypothetical protein